MQGIKLTHVEQMQIRLHISANISLGTRLQIKIHDGECRRPFCHQIKQTRREHVNARKGITLQFVHFDVVKRALYLASSNVCPPTQAHVVIKQQVALRIALAHHQRGISLQVLLVKGSYRRIAQYVDIMNKDRRTILCKQWCSMTQSATRVEQFVSFVRYTHWHRPLVLCHKVNNLLCKVVHIHHNLGSTLRYQMPQNNVNNSNDNGNRLSLSDVLNGGSGVNRDDKSQFVADPEKKDGGFFKWIKGLLPKNRPGMREGETEDEYDRRRTRNMQMVATLEDAIRHIGNIVNTSKGATQQKFNSPVELLEQGYQQRKAERQKQAALDSETNYRNASLSLKQAAAEAAERHRLFEEKLGLTNLGYKQIRDAVNDAHWNQNYERIVNNDEFNHNLATDKLNESKRHNSVSENQGQQRINLTAIREARMAAGGGSGSGGGKGSAKFDRFATPGGYMSRKTKLSGIEKKQLAQYLIKHGYINEDNLTAYKNLSLLDNSKGVNDLVNSWIGYAANTRGAKGAVFRNILKNNYGYSESSTVPKLPTRPAAKPQQKGKSGGKKGWASGFKL